MTRGEKINNPGNIRLSDQHWVGKIYPSSDADFEQFDTPEHGIRAMAKILLTYFHNGINTIGDTYDTNGTFRRGIISTWAPASDNNPVAAYVENVCSRSGYNENACLMLTSLHDLSPVIFGMIDQEQGGCIYSMDQIETGCRMALGTL